MDFQTSPMVTNLLHLIFVHQFNNKLRIDKKSLIFAKTWNNYFWINLVMAWNVLLSIFVCFTITKLLVLKTSNYTFLVFYCFLFLDLLKMEIIFWADCFLILCCNVLDILFSTKIRAVVDFLSTCNWNNFLFLDKTANIAFIQNNENNSFSIALEMGIAY